MKNDKNLIPPRDRFENVARELGFDESDDALDKAFGRIKPDQVSDPLEDEEIEEEKPAKLRAFLLPIPQIPRPTPPEHPAPGTATDHRRNK